MRHCPGAPTSTTGRLSWWSAEAPSAAVEQRSAGVARTEGQDRHDMLVPHHPLKYVLTLRRHPDLAPVRRSACELASELDATKASSRSTARSKIDGVREALESPSLAPASVSRMIQDGAINIDRVSDVDGRQSCRARWDRHRWSPANAPVATGTPTSSRAACSRGPCSPRGSRASRGCVRVRLVVIRQSTCRIGALLGVLDGRYELAVLTEITMASRSSKFQDTLRTRRSRAPTR